jgi:hypothetical protein
VTSKWGDFDEERNSSFAVDYFTIFAGRKYVTDTRAYIYIYAYKGT